MSPTFRALSHASYRRYYAGGLVSNVGTWMQRVAQDWLVLQLTGNSGTALGITTGLQFLPILVLSAYAGAIADRFPRLRLLKLAQVLMAVPALVLGVLALTGVAQQWHVYVVALVFGVATAFEAPVRQAFLSELVPVDDLPNAVGLNSASFNVGRIVGPAVAGVLIAAFGSGVRATGLVIILNAVSYGAVLIALHGVGGRTAPRTGTADVRPSPVVDGLRYVRSRPDLLLVLAVMFFVGTFGLNFQLTSALMATETYGKGAGEYGILGSTMALGSLAGALLAARRASATPKLVVMAALGFAGVETLIGLMPTYTLFVLTTPLLGISAMTMITSANTVMQLTVPSELRGRVMALYLMVFMGGTPLGSPLIGWIGETLGPRWSLVGGALGAAAGTLVAVAVFWRLGRRREDPAPDEDRAATRPAPVDGRDPLGAAGRHSSVA